MSRVKIVYRCIDTIAGWIQSGCNNTAALCWVKKLKVAGGRIVAHATEEFLSELTRKYFEDDESYCLDPNLLLEMTTHDLHIIKVKHANTENKGEPSNKENG